MKFSRTILMFVVLITSYFSLSTPAMAQPPGDYGVSSGQMTQMRNEIVKALREIKTLMQDISQAYFGVDVQKRATAQQPTQPDETAQQLSQSITAAENTTIHKAEVQAHLNIDKAPPEADFTMQLLKNTLAAANEGDKPGFANIDPLLADYLSSFKISTPFPLPGQKEKNKDDENRLLNMDALLAPTLYKSKKETSYSSRRGTEQAGQPHDAQAFIRVLMANPSSVPTLTRTEFVNMGDPKNPKQLSEKQKTYLSNVRAYVAFLSVALSNYSEMYAKRQPSKELKDESSLGALTNNVNKHCAEIYKNLPDDWYTDLANAPPAKVQRMMIPMMCNMETLLLQSYLQNERILATLSAAQLQGLLTMKGMIREQ